MTPNSTQASRIAVVTAEQTDQRSGLTISNAAELLPRRICLSAPLGLSYIRDLRVIMGTKLATLKPRVPEISTSRVTHGDSWRDDKRGSTQRGYTYRWQQESKRFLSEHPLCVDCKAEGRVVVATEVDHEIPHRGDTTLFWDQSNWRSRCKPHHSAKTARGE